MAIVHGVQLPKSLLESDNKGSYDPIMSTVAETQGKYRAKRRTKSADGGIGAPLMRPMPAPGEHASVGYGDWATYVGLSDALQDCGYRVQYFKGVIEIMGISFDHESLGALGGRIGSLVEAFCLWAGIDFEICGSTTQRKEDSAGAEADESYTFGQEPKDKPELVIEVALTSGSIDKLELWKELGAKEAWIWQNNRLHGFFRSEGADFQPITESVQLPGLKLPLVEEFARMRPSSKAVREFRRKLESGG